MLSSEHFSVDGTLLEAWASLKSFRPKDGSGEPPAPGRNGERDFHAERRRTTRMLRPPIPTPVSSAKGRAKRSTAVFHGARADGEPQRSDYRGGDHARFGPCRATGGADADRAPCRAPAASHARGRQRLRRQRICHGVARQGGHPACCAEHQRSPFGDRRPTTRHPGYAISQRIRKRVEEAFGWAKTVAGLRKVRHRGLPKIDWQFTLAMAAYDLVRLPKLLAWDVP